jgi:hypothetical protein
MGGGGNLGGEGASDRQTPAAKSLYRSIFRPTFRVWFFFSFFVHGFKPTLACGGRESTTVRHEKAKKLKKDKKAKLKSGARGR